MRSRWNLPITLSVTVKGENSPFMGEHFWKLFVELTLHSAKITSTYTALANCTPNYAFQRGGTFPVHRNAQSWMQLKTNVTTLTNSHIKVWLNRRQLQPRKINPSSSSLPHLVPISPPALLPHLLLPRLPGDLWPPFDPLPFQHPILPPLHLLTSHFPPPPLHSRKCVQIRVRHRKQLG